MDNMKLDSPPPILSRLQPLNLNERPKLRKRLTSLRPNLPTMLAANPNINMEIKSIQLNEKSFQIGQHFLNSNSDNCVLPSPITHHRFSTTFVSHSSTQNKENVENMKNSLNLNFANWKRRKSLKNQDIKRDRSPLIYPNSIKNEPSEVEDLQVKETISNENSNLISKSGHKRRSSLTGWLTRNLRHARFSQPIINKQSYPSIATDSIDIVPIDNRTSQLVHNEYLICDQSLTRNATKSGIELFKKRKSEFSKFALKNKNICCDTYLKPDM